VPRLDEISILSPGSIAWYQGAKITRVVELPKVSAARTPAATEEVVHHPPVRVKRYYPTKVSLPPPFSAWPVGELVTHIRPGVVMTESGRIIRDS
jgi:hypothetical protein